MKDLYTESKAILILELVEKNDADGLRTVISKIYDDGFEDGHFEGARDEREEQSAFN